MLTCVSWKGPRFKRCGSASSAASMMSRKNPVTREISDTLAAEASWGPRGYYDVQYYAAGLLDQLAAQNGLKSAVFTAVGYGVQDRVVGGGEPYFQDANPIPRMYAFSAFNSLNGGYIRLSQNAATGNGGTCYGDSGGPNFLPLNGQLILAATTVTGDDVCMSTNVDYRLDTASARLFLGQYVTLP